MHGGLEPRKRIQKKLNSTSQKIRTWDREKSTTLKVVQAQQVKKKQGVTPRRATEVKVKHQSPVHALQDEISGSENDLQDLSQQTPTRHSAATTSGKKFKFAESSSADDAFDLDIKSEPSYGEQNVTGASPNSASKEAVETEGIE